jgi:hypothetical protein
MAVDKKSDHVGNHGGRYTDIDGHTKQFTYVDHDVKTSISTTKLSPEDKDALKDEVSRYRTNLILRILTLPPSMCPEIFQDFTIRGEDVENILWNETMIQDPGLPLQKLVDLKTFIEKKAEALRYTL